MKKVTEEVKNRLNKALALRNVKPIELSEMTKIPKSSISQYMSGYSKPNSERTLLICQALNINEAWLLGYNVPMERADTSRFPSPNITEEYTTFPVIGEIAAGYDHIALESWDGDTVDVPDSYLRGYQKDEFFVLCVKGDSMYPTYQEGDKVLILKQSVMNFSGEIGAVLYDDEIATLKKVEYKQGEDWIRLVPVNPNFPPMTIEGEQLNHCRIIGIPKLLLREVNQ